MCPLDPTYPPPRLSFMLEDTQAPVLITVQSQVARLPAHNAQVVCLDTDAAVLAAAEYGRPSASGRRRASRLCHLYFWVHGAAEGRANRSREFAESDFLAPAGVRGHYLDRATQLAGPAFDATVWELWPYLTIGASVYLPDEDTRVSPLRLRDWLVERGITITFLPTT